MKGFLICNTVFPPPSINSSKKTVMKKIEIKLLLIVVKSEYPKKEGPRGRVDVII